MLVLNNIAWTSTIRNKQGIEQMSSRTSLADRTAMFKSFICEQNAGMHVCYYAVGRLQYLSIDQAPWQSIDKTPLICSEEFTYPSAHLPCVILITTSTVSRISTTALSHPHRSPWASLPGPSSSPSKSIPALPPQRTQSL